MKEILKVMRFDYLTAKPLAFGIFSFIVLLVSIMSLLFSPMIAGYIAFGAMMFVIPLQSIADKSDLHKLYGILPVKRQNITRARFIYIFLTHFTTEIMAIIFSIISINLKLYRILPNQNGEMMQMVKNSFNDTSLTLISTIGISSSFCLIFLYMEMMGQIHGRENEMKIIIITFAIVTTLAVGFFSLSNHGIIPTINLPSMPSTVSGKIILGATLNVVIFFISLLFGEITANKLAKREL